jgi:hypothetical protein
MWPYSEDGNVARTSQRYQTGISETGGNRPTGLDARQARKPRNCDKEAGNGLVDVVRIKEFQRGRVVRVQNGSIPPIPSRSVIASLPSLLAATVVLFWDCQRRMGTTAVCDRLLSNSHRLLPLGWHITRSRRDG